MTTSEELISNEAIDSTIKIAIDTALLDPNKTQGRDHRQLMKMFRDNIAGQFGKIQTVWDAITVYPPEYPYEILEFNGTTNSYQAYKRTAEPLPLDLTTAPAPSADTAQTYYIPKGSNTDLSGYWTALEVQTAIADLRTEIMSLIGPMPWYDLDYDTNEGSNIFIVPKDYPEIAKAIIYNAEAPRIFYNAEFVRTPAGDDINDVITMVTTLQAHDIVSLVPQRSGPLPLPQPSDTRPKFRGMWEPGPYLENDLVISTDGSGIWRVKQDILQSNASPYNGIYWENVMPRAMYRGVFASTNKGFIAADVVEVPNIGYYRAKNNLTNYAGQPNTDTDNWIAILTFDKPRGFKDYIQGNAYLAKDIITDGELVAYVTAPFTASQQQLVGALNFAEEAVNLKVVVRPESDGSYYSLGGFGTLDAQYTVNSKYQKHYLGIESSGSLTLLAPAEDFQSNLLEFDTSIFLFVKANKQVALYCEAFMFNPAPPVDLLPLSTVDETYRLDFKGGGFFKWANKFDYIKPGIPGPSLLSYTVNRPYKAGDVLTGQGLIAEVKSAFTTDGKGFIEAMQTGQLGDLNLNLLARKEYGGLTTLSGATQKTLAINGASKVYYVQANGPTDAFDHVTQNNNIYITGNSPALTNYDIEIQFRVNPYVKLNITWDAAYFVSPPPTTVFPVESTTKLYTIKFAGIRGFAPAWTWANAKDYEATPTTIPIKALEDVQSQLVIENTILRGVNNSIILNQDAIPNSANLAELINADVTAHGNKYQLITRGKPTWNQLGDTDAFNFTTAPVLLLGNDEPSYTLRVPAGKYFRAQMSKKALLYIFTPIVFYLELEPNSHILLTFDNNYAGTLPTVTETAATARLFKYEFILGVDNKLYWVNQTTSVQAIETDAAPTLNSNKVPLSGGTYSAIQQVITDLKGTAPAAGDTLGKLYNLLVNALLQESQPTLAAMYNDSATAGQQYFIVDDGDGKWAVYKANGAGTQAQGNTYTKINDQDTLNNAITAPAMKTALAAITDTHFLTDAEYTKLAGLTQYTDEQAKDTAGALLASIAAGSAVTFGYNSTSNTLTVSALNASTTSRGVARLYTTTLLGTNTDGAPTQNAVKVYVDTAIAEPGLASLTGTSIDFGATSTATVTLTADTLFTLTNPKQHRTIILRATGAFLPTFEPTVKKKKGSAYDTAKTNSIYITCLDAVAPLYEYIISPDA